jgi:hypothetical protein
MRGLLAHHWHHRHRRAGVGARGLRLVAPAADRSDERRPDHPRGDRPAVVSAVLGIAPIAGLEGNETLYVELLGVVLVGQLLCTVLAPLVRRLSAGAERPVIAVATERERLATELTAVADRLERLEAGPRVNAECERLRRLARTVGVQ